MKRVFFILFLGIPFLFLPLMDFFDIGENTVYSQRLNAKFFSTIYYVVLFFIYIFYKKYIKKPIKKTVGLEKLNKIDKGLNLIEDVNSTKKGIDKEFSGDE